MKLSELEGYEVLGAKLDSKASTAELEKLRADLTKTIMESERAQRFWIWGLYIVIILSHFWK